MGRTVDMERRGLFAKREWPVLLLIGLAATAALGLAWNRPAGVTAVVERDGQAVMTRDLSRLAEPESVRITGENGIVLTVEFSSKGVCITEAGCPDKTCQRTGLLTRAGESAVCLPGRVVLRLEGPDSAASMDAETY